MEVGIGRTLLLRVYLARSTPVTRIECAGPPRHREHQGLTPRLLAGTSQSESDIPIRVRLIRVRHPNPSQSYPSQSSHIQPQWVSVRTSSAHPPAVFCAAWCARIRVSFTTFIRVASPVDNVPHVVHRRICPPPAPPSHATRAIASESQPSQRPCFGVAGRRAGGRAGG